MRFADDALKLLDHLDLKINLNIKGDRSNRFISTAALHSLTLDHARAICNLIKIGVPASAFALLRVAFESYIRGAWIHHCASDKQVETFYKNKGIKENPNAKEIDFEKLVQQVEQATGSPAYLSAIKTKSWKALNSYTHSGMHQISRYIVHNTITPNFSEDEKYEVVELSLILSCFSLAGILDLCKVENSELIADEILVAVIAWKKSYKPKLPA